MKTWAERIDEAEERGYFTEEDCELAIKWPTCACGEQDARIPRDEDGTPKDADLLWMGSTFAAQVAIGYFQDARETMARIESRAVVLLQRMAPKEEEALVS